MVKHHKNLIYEQQCSLKMVNVPELKGKVLQFIQMNGPTLPIQISKVIGRDTFFAGAILSELLGSKQLKTTTAKVGGSVLYYMPGQEARLSVLFNYLPQKEKEVYLALQQQGVIRDKDAEPSLRVALRNSKDFAMAFMSDPGTGEEVFWRWYLIPEEQARQRIQPQQITQQVQQPTTITNQESMMQAKRKEMIQQPLIEVKKQETVQAIQETTKQKKAGRKKTLPQEDAFLQTIEAYLEQHRMKVIEKEVVKKNQESVLVVHMQTPMGEMPMLVIAKNKKKISEEDVMIAVHKSQNKKLPGILLAKGDLAKKAEEYMEKHLKGTLLFKKII